MPMKPSSRTRGRKFITATVDHAKTNSDKAQRGWLLGAALLGALGVLYFFNPIEHAFYPACFFYKLTHLHCPSCGGLRAIHQLTHGNFTAAFHSNPLLTSSIPWLTWLGISKLRDRSGGALVIQPAVAWTLLAIILLFGILRNLPFSAFAWMSP